MALSLGLPPPGITRHRYFMESGLSSDVATRDHPAIRAMNHLGADPALVNGEAYGKISHQPHIGFIQWFLAPRAKPLPESVQRVIRRFCC